MGYGETAICEHCHGSVLYYYYNNVARRIMTRFMAAVCSEVEEDTFLEHSLFSTLAQNFIHIHHISRLEFEMSPKE